MEALSPALEADRIVTDATLAIMEGVGPGSSNVQTVKTAISFLRRGGYELLSPDVQEDLLSTAGESQRADFSDEHLLSGPPEDPAVFAGIAHVKEDIAAVFAQAVFDAHSVLAN